MEPFDLDLAKSGKSVCTRDGTDVRIVSFDGTKAFPIVGIMNDESGEILEGWTSDGYFFNEFKGSHRDLLMKRESFDLDFYYQGNSVCAKDGMNGQRMSIKGIDEHLVVGITHDEDGKGLQGYSNNGIYCGKQDIGCSLSYDLELDKAGHSVNKIKVYFIMQDENPDVGVFLKMSEEILSRGFDDNNFQRIMIMTPTQIAAFFRNCMNYFSTIDDLNKGTFAGFMLINFMDVS